MQPLFEITCRPLFLASTPAAEDLAFIMLRKRSLPVSSVCRLDGATARASLTSRLHYPSLAPAQSCSGVSACHADEAHHIEVIRILVRGKTPLELAPHLAEAAHQAPPRRQIVCTSCCAPEPVAPPDWSCGPTRHRNRHSHRPRGQMLSASGLSECFQHHRPSGHAPSSPLAHVWPRDVDRVVLRPPLAFALPPLFSAVRGRGPARGPSRPFAVCLDSAALRTAAAGAAGQVPELTFAFLADACLAGGSRQVAAGLTRLAAAGRQVGTLPEQVRADCSIQVDHTGATCLLEAPRLHLERNVWKRRLFFCRLMVFALRVMPPVTLTRPFEPASNFSAPGGFQARHGSRPPSARRLTWPGFAARGSTRSGRRHCLPACRCYSVVWRLTRPTCPPGPSTT